jgi:hypothetical protein
VTRRARPAGRQAAGHAAHRLPRQRQDHAASQAACGIPVDEPRGRGHQRVGEIGIDHDIVACRPRTSRCWPTAASAARCAPTCRTRCASCSASGARPDGGLRPRDHRDHRPGRSGARGADAVQRHHAGHALPARRRGHAGRCVNGAGQHPHPARRAVKQIALADRVFITKSDLAPAEPSRRSGPRWPTSTRARASAPGTPCRVETLCFIDQA